MFDVSNAIDNMVKAGIMNADDVFFYAMKKPNAAGALFGVVGALAAMSAATRYLGCFNEEKGLVLFEIDDNGIAAGARLAFNFDQPYRVNVGGFWRDFAISIAQGGIETKFIIPTRINNYPKQKENRDRIRAFLKSRPQY